MPMSYSRAEILNTLIRRLNSFSEGYRQNIAIIGEPYIGKTSLIKSLLSSEEVKRDAIIPIYIEIKIEPFEFCAKRFIKSALFQLLKSDPSLTSSHDTVLLIEDLKRTYPKTANICIRALQDLEKNKFDEVYSFILDIPATIFEETKKRCVFILDEFHNMGNFLLKHPFGTLAKKIMIQKDTMYLLLSSKSIAAQRIFTEKLSMLFGNFEKIFLLPFDIAMSRSFLQERIKGATFPRVYLDFLASFSGNKPFYMQAICDEIERTLYSRKAAPNDYAKIIESAITETVFKKSGLINQHFSGFFFKLSDGKLVSKSASVLIALSSENKKQFDIAKSSKLQVRDISKILNRLIETDVVVRNGSLYRFKDSLFCFWVQCVYLKKILSFSIDEAVEEDLFRKDLTSRMEIFVREFEKEISSRIIDLFGQFKNDVVQLNGRKHKFRMFSNIQKLEDNLSDGTNILAANGKLKWLCSVRKGYVTEGDITAIIKNAKKKKQGDRINKNILISLGGIDENAYLMAKEAKFWIWDLDSLNVLMDLYGKPHITG